MRTKNLAGIIYFILLAFAIEPIYIAVAKMPFGYEDAMKFRTIQSPSISFDGKWVAFSSVPDRGDPDVIVKGVENDSIKYSVERGSHPVFSRNSLWVAMVLNPKAVDLENADKDENKPKKGMALLKIANGDVVKFDNVENFVFANNSKWLAYKLFSNEEKSKKPDDNKKKNFGSDLVLRHLESGSEITFQNVTEFTFDSIANFLGYVVSEPTGKKNGIYYIDLNSNFTFPQKVEGVEKARYADISWNNKNGFLAYIKGSEKKDGDVDSCSVYIWNDSTKKITKVVSFVEIQKGWKIPVINKLRWTQDGKRLFFGTKPEWEFPKNKPDVKFNDSDYYNIDTIIKKADLDVWHWNDPRIKSNQKNWWDKNKDNTYLAYYNTETGRFIQLADTSMPYVEFVDNPVYTVGYNNKQYIKEITWSGEFQDIYVINLQNGTRKLLLSHSPEGANISPGGNYICYFSNKDWYLYNCKLDTTVILNKDFKVNFADEDWDQPSTAPSYGVGGWLENDNAVLIYDKYDIWKFFTTADAGFMNQSAADGRFSDVSFRIPRLDPDKIYFKPNEEIYITGFNHSKKYTCIYKMSFDVLGTESVIFENDKIHILGQAKDSKKILFTKERYDLYPDLWVGDSTLKTVKRVTDQFPEIDNYKWGTAEQVNWVNSDRDSLQGFIIKPYGYNPVKRYPVLVYFYEKFSDLLFNFWAPRLNHRPCFQIYSSDDYIIFLPDIKYKTGFPGYNATDCIVSGLRKLIDTGLADSTAIGIQGHSWGGYQTAFMITQTDIFAAAVAGAPVANMTSAYSGIRLESGMARQFQYEKEQSRIGGTLWDSLDSYLRNSPVFQLKNVKTPLMLMFGDMDDAVPWQQGQELYLDMRRLDKTCIFLLYHNEPHIMKKYANKVDYSIKMKQYFDYYLKGKSAPDWLIKGVEYMGWK